MRATDVGFERFIRDDEERCTEHRVAGEPIREQAIAAWSEIADLAAVRPVPITANEYAERFRKLHGLPSTMPYAELAERMRKDWQSPATKPEAIESLGKRVYRVGSVPMTVNESQDAVLQAFLSRPAMSGEELVGATKRGDAVNILKRMANSKRLPFGQFITLPGEKSAGGYSVKIKSIATP